ncbi:Protein of unknown function (DUF506) [Quillaja saponaria]|uniref:Uncharacterized protein n=1 Tax=Quillaja saponaria TaxID=32244 RepID=A0AAD7PAI7_QUISA|nr:Protein of unknown function (DUF506) [Quillaja saponaria]
MEGELPGILATRQNSGHEMVSFSDTLFGFLEDVENSSGNSCNSNEYEDDGDYEDEKHGNVQKNKAFWEKQDQLLQDTLCRSSATESKIRQATNEAMKELHLSCKQYCICGRTVAEKGCRNCLQREICKWLLSLGYNCSICKSKWKSSTQIPSGEHTYLEVMVDASNAKNEMRVIIELNFRAEFEMARANEEYNRLVCRLPELFVGKTERLRNLIKIMCSSAKKCMKEKKMYLGPWRKQRYMQAKWLGTCERSTPAPSPPPPPPPPPPPLPVIYLDRPPKSRASMLTFDLLENFPGLHHTVVAVV